MTNKTDWVVSEPTNQDKIASYAEVRWNDINEQLLEMGHEVGDTVVIDPDAFWQEHFGIYFDMEDLEKNYDLFVRATENGEMVSVDVAKKVIEYFEAVVDEL
jgi:hypothetical protein